MNMRKTALAPGQLLRSVHMEESYHGKAGYPVLYKGLPASRSYPGATKNSCEQLQASDRSPRQSLPRGHWVAPGQWVVPGSCEQALRRSWRHARVDRLSGDRCSYVCFKTWLNEARRNIGLSPTMGFSWMKMTVWLILQFWETCRQVCLLLWAFQDFLVFSHYQLAFSDGKEGHTSQHPNVLFGLRRPSIRTESVLAFCTNVSVYSKPDNPPPEQTPGNFFERVNSPSLVHKENAKPWPLGQKNCAKTPGQLFPKKSSKRTQNRRQKLWKKKQYWNAKQICLEILTQWNT